MALGRVRGSAVIGEIIDSNSQKASISQRYALEKRCRCSLLPVCTMCIGNHWTEPMRNTSCMSPTHGLRMKTWEFFVTGIKSRFRGSPQPNSSHQDFKARTSPSHPRLRVKSGQPQTLDPSWQLPGFSAIQPHPFWLPHPHSVTTTALFLPLAPPTA